MTVTFLQRIKWRDVHADETDSMISNERPSPYGYRPQRRSSGHGHGHGGQGSGYGQPKPQVNEDTLRTEKIQIERKTFILTLKENPRGRFLRITEDVNGHRDNIIIPSTGLQDFKRIVDEMVKLSDETPPNIPGVDPAYPDYPVDDAQPPFEENGNQAPGPDQNPA